MSKKLTKKERFVEKARKIHGEDRYDYSQSVFNGCLMEITIVCNKCVTSFSQRASNHLQGCGCPLCGIANKRLTKEQFIDKAIKKHGDKYDYSNVIHVDNKNKVLIACNKCKTSFEQKPSAHLYGKGCPSCGVTNQRFTKEQFIEKARKKHGDKYDYSNVVYVNSYTKVSIMCNSCKTSFVQEANGHLCGHGCPHCIYKSYSKIAMEWLKYLEIKHNIKIQHAENGGEYRIPNTKYHVDGYCKDTNTVFEFHGDFWHGNPEMFDAEQQSGIKNMSYGELYKKTIEKENKIKSLGYNLIVIWENEWKKVRKNIL